MTELAWKPDLAGLAESSWMPEEAAEDVICEGGDGWSAVVPAGGRLRIVDVHGKQGVDALFYDAHDATNRYSNTETVCAQQESYLTTGSRLLTIDGDELMTIVADTCGRHDTMGGACAQETNVVRYGAHTRHEHTCRSTFLVLAAEHGMTARDLTHNINFFTNVPITPEGKLSFEHGMSGPGKYVELQAARDTLVLISNCPQLNNPCNDFNPTAIRILRWGPSAAGQ
jgi:urea carboxylase-associated protein 1